MHRQPAPQLLLTYLQARLIHEVVLKEPGGDLVPLPDAPRLCQTIRADAILTVDKHPLCHARVRSREHHEPAIGMGIDEIESERNAHTPSEPVRQFRCKPLSFAKSEERLGDPFIALRIDSAVNPIRLRHHIGFQRVTILARNQNHDLVVGPHVPPDDHRRRSVPDSLPTRRRHEGAYQTARFVVSIQRRGDHDILPSQHAEISGVCERDMVKALLPGRQDYTLENVAERSLQSPAVRGIRNDRDHVDATGTGRQPIQPQERKQPIFNRRQLYEGFGPARHLNRGPDPAALCQCHQNQNRSQQQTCAGEAAFVAPSGIQQP